MSRTILVSYDLHNASAKAEEIEAMLTAISIAGEVVAVAPSAWLLRTAFDLSEVAARIKACSQSMKERWMIVNVSNRIFAWSGQDKEAHRYMSAINLALQKQF